MRGCAERIWVESRRQVCKRHLHQRGARLDGGQPRQPATVIADQPRDDSLDLLDVYEGRMPGAASKSGRATSTGRIWLPTASSILNLWRASKASHSASMSPPRLRSLLLAMTLFAAPVTATVSSCSANCIIQDGSTRGPWHQAAAPPRMGR